MQEMRAALLHLTGLWTFRPVYSVHFGLKFSRPAGLVIRTWIEISKRQGQSARKLGIETSAPTGNVGGTLGD